MNGIAQFVHELREILNKKNLLSNDTQSMINRLLRSDSIRVRIAVLRSLDIGSRVHNPKSKTAWNKTASDLWVSHEVNTALNCSALAKASGTNLYFMDGDMYELDY